MHEFTNTPNVAFLASWSVVLLCICFDLFISFYAVLPPTFNRNYPYTLLQFHPLWLKVGGKGADIPNTFLLALGSCDSDSFPNIHQLLLIS